MYQDTVTVFNRRRAPEGDVWYPTVLTGVRLITDRGALAGRLGGESQDRALLLVPCVMKGGKTLVGGREYLPPKQWQRTEDPAGALTFAFGEGFDFFIRGAWEDGPVRDGDYPGGLYQCVDQALDDAYAVTGVARFGALPHFEVTGR